MKWLSDNNTTLENLQHAAKLPALKQLLYECNIGTDKDSEDILVSYIKQLSEFLISGLDVI